MTRPRKRKGLTPKQVQEEVRRIRDRSEQADREDAPLFLEQMAERIAEEEIERIRVRSEAADREAAPLFLEQMAERIAEEELDGERDQGLNGCQSFSVTP